VSSVKPVSENKKQPNRLMRAMIAVSLALHALIFMHIAGIYQSRALTYIELTLRDTSKPPARAIPRPRIRHKAPKAETVNQRKMTVQPLPVPVVTSTVQPKADSLTADIGTPAVPVSGWDMSGAPVFATTGDYFDMVRLKIESRKKYPESAREKQIQGRVVVRFLITGDGQISSLEIVKSSRHDVLDKAALEAVRNAAPFPRPPADLFKDALRVEITILFELR